MDGIDFTLSIALMINSRIPYRKLAEDFNMSVNSIHKRIKKMVNLGIIQRFNARLSPTFLPYHYVIMFGLSNAKNLDEILQKLGVDEHIYNVTQASGNFLYIHANLRALNELDSLISFIKQVGEIEDLSVCLDKDSPVDFAEYFEKVTLSNLDYLIVNSLKDNSRKLITEIAEEIGSSSKTVKRHLDRMVEKNVIMFSLDWYPDKTGLSLAHFHINLKPAVDKEKFIESLREKYGNTIVFTWKFSNFPDLLLTLVWSACTKDLQTFKRSLGSENIESIDVNLLFTGENFPTWQDQYLEAKINEIEKSSN